MRVCVAVYRKWRLEEWKSRIRNVYWLKNELTSFLLLPLHQKKFKRLVLWIYVFFLSIEDGWMDLFQGRQVKLVTWRFYLSFSSSFFFFHLHSDISLQFRYSIESFPKRIALLNLVIFLAVGGMLPLFYMSLLCLPNRRERINS